MSPHKSHECFSTQHFASRTTSIQSISCLQVLAQTSLRCCRHVLCRVRGCTSQLCTVHRRCFKLFPPRRCSSSVVQVSNLDVHGGSLDEGKGSYAHKVCQQSFQHCGFTAGRHCSTNPQHRDLRTGDSTQCQETVARKWLRLSCIQVCQVHGDSDQGDEGLAATSNPQTKIMKRLFTHTHTSPVVRQQKE